MNASSDAAILLRSWFGAALLLLSGAIRAGTSCEERVMGAADLQSASRVALNVLNQLEEQDRPFAILSRIGQDLSNYGQRYSHAGLVVRDHPRGRWTVVHQLNQCGSASSGIYLEGLLDFFLDDLYHYEAHLLWPDDALNEALGAALAQGAELKIYDPNYNLIARYGSSRTQNSTAWLAELLGYAMAENQPACRRASGRERAHCALRELSFQPDQIHISYGKRIAGGLFSANTVFTDHPVGARLSGRYQVVTVNSILRFAGPRSWKQTEVE